MAAEIKTLKVISCIKTDREPDNYGNSSYNVKFEGDISGLYNGKKPQYFEAGKTIPIGIEAKVSKSNVKWNKITLPQKENSTSGGGGGGYKKDPATQYRIAKTVSLKVAVKVKRMASFETGKLFELSDTLLQFIMEKSEGAKDEGNAIAAQSALDLTAETMQDPKFPVTDMKTFMEWSNAFYNFIIKPKEEIPA